MNLEEIRRDYLKTELSEAGIDKSPLKQFGFWLQEAIRMNVHDATAMYLGTTGLDGFPQSRIVLLKDFNDLGFTFFTNYKSNKGKELENNPKVSLLFFWPELERQIRISGYANKTAAEVSEKYFYSRPVLSQIAASISEQSKEIPSREFLEDKFDKLQDQLNGKPPKYPSNWGGYLVTPIRFEFWQGREKRLHDRIIYDKISDSWKLKRLAP